MSKHSVQIFAADLPGVYEHYKRAFNATLLFDGHADDGTLIHLQLDIMGMSLGVAPKKCEEIIKGNTIQLCLPFADEQSLRHAYSVIEEGGSGEGLQPLPWSALQGYVTDKFGVMWCIGL